MTQATAQEGITLRVSITDRCDLRCLYCLPSEGLTGLGPRTDLLSFEEIARVASAVTRVAPAVAVRITGGEPLLRRNIDRLVAMLDALELADLAITTSGQNLAGLAACLKKAGLRRVNVSLDTLRPERFARLTRGGSLDKTIAGIDAALESDLTPVKLNAVVLRGTNDDEVCDLVRFAASRGCEMRFIELMPIGEAAPQHDELFVATPEIRTRLEREFELAENASGSHAPARTFAVRSLDGEVTGTVGFISPMSHPFCDGCRRLRLTSRGELLGCLMHGQGLDVRTILRNGTADTEIERLVRSALVLKAAGLKMPRTAPMATVGG